MVVVPSMSLPIFIPEKNNSFLDNLGLFRWTSYKADDIAIDVSLIFPIKPIIIIPDEPEDNFYTFCYEDRNLGDYDLKLERKPE